MKHIFSIDVEDWYHILEIDSKYTNVENWGKFPQRVDYSFNRLLDVLDKHNTKSTCFFLGWIAEKYPHLVKSAYDKGHEIAIHGYSHKLVYQQTPQEFYDEIYKTKVILEDITGDSVVGYRAPGFSITKDSLWAYEVLMKLNFKYSSSIFPSKRAHGYYENFGTNPKVIEFEGKEIIELPVSSLKDPFSVLNCFGGGYFRLYPYLWFKIAAKIFNDPIIFYIHPRDIDYEQPKIDLSLSRRIKSYINIKSTENKISKMLADYTFTSFEDIMKNLDKNSLPKTTLSLSKKQEFVNSL